MKNNLKFIFACLLLGTGVTYAQVGVGTTTPNASSALDVTSTTKGFLMPRMTTTERTAITTPANGLQVYDTTTNSQWYYNGTIWVEYEKNAKAMSFTKNVWVNGTNPNSATQFDDVFYYNAVTNTYNASFVHDSALMGDVNNMYIGSDGSGWYYNGTAYIPYNEEANTAWYLQGSTSDAGNDKNAAIYRRGELILDNDPLSFPTKSTYSLTIQNTKAVLNPANNSYYSSGFQNIIRQYVANSTAHYGVGGYVRSFVIVPSGVTNSGYNQTLNVESVRRTLPGFADNGGTISSIAGAVISVGHTTAGIGTTNNAYGLQIIGSFTSGTIGNYYDILVGPGATGAGATVTNKFGIYLQGADKINIFDGRFGLGTTTPTAKLDVNGYIRLRSASDVVADANLQSGLLRYNSGLQFYNGTNWLTPLTPNANGDVAIGHSSAPATRLDITTPLNAGANTNALSLNHLSSAANSEVSLIFGASTGPAIRYSSISAINNGSNGIALKFTTGEGATITEKMRISPLGNVGIGTTTPTSKLQVVGLPVHVDNAAALTAGLTAGAFYHSGDGIVRVVY